MITIRDEQIRLLAEARTARFEQALVLHVRQHFPDLQSSAESLVRAAQRKAASYGLTSSQDLYRFVNVCAVEGLDFDQRPITAWMREALLDRSISSPSERLRVLTSALLRRAAVAEQNARVTAPRTPSAVPAWLR